MTSIKIRNSDFYKLFILMSQKQLCSEPTLAGAVLGHLVAYSRCTQTGLGQVQGTGPAQQETMGPGSSLYLGPVRTFLSAPIGPVLFPVLVQKA